MLQGPERPRWMIIYDRTVMLLILALTGALIYTAARESSPLWLALALIPLALAIIVRAMSWQGILLYGAPIPLVHVIYDAPMGPIWIPLTIAALAIGAANHMEPRQGGAPPPRRPLLEQLFVPRRFARLERVFE